MSAILENPQHTIAIAGIFASAVTAALIVHYLAFKIINRINPAPRRGGVNQSIPTPVGIPQGALTPLLIEAGRQPVRWIILVIATRLVMPLAAPDKNRANRSIKLSFSKLTFLCGPI